ncbi:MAG: site-specific DNA-methyltransferase [Candidatus Altiarchaeales archaeon HGW-Altiarchaeales-1]|nr:MAG: site-specific DNA-methyltransferase [Candidatus Altiarchaeales archaeon HGW-Altiarchaeales-1]
MKNNDFINKIITGDALEVLAKIEDDSIDVVLTDPPYFLDKLDNNWKYTEVPDKKYCIVVKSLPAGMKFDRQQGINLYNWFLNVSKELYRVLKKGGFFFSFSSPRLYHRMASAVDDAGFMIRDCFVWIYTQNQPKAMGLNHFIDKLDINKSAKEELKKKLSGWKTPQIKSCFEPIIVAQKPPDKTFLENIINNEVGLFNTNIKVGDNMYPSNILTIDHISEIMDKSFLVGKPTKNERGDYNFHMTVKPLAICEHIIKLSAFSKDAVILDPFVGSGTTAVAAKNAGKNFIGIDSNPEYTKIALERLNNLQHRLL